LAVKPPNYVEKPKVPDKYPPKYEYKYFIANRHTQAAQGHKESRNGDNTQGNYFVNHPKGESKASVKYIADEWGYHPVARYSLNGPHHRVSSHFALGQHAVEQLNQNPDQNNLNTNEILFNQYSLQQPQDSLSTSQFAFDPKSSLQASVIDDKIPTSGIYAPNQPHYDQQHIIVQPLVSPYNQQLPLYRNQEKHSVPVTFQHVQQLPFIYQYAQQPNQPHFNYFYQHKPQEVIYHQQPIASMATPPQQHLIIENLEVSPPDIDSEKNNESINNAAPKVELQQEDKNVDLRKLQPESPLNSETGNNQMNAEEKEIDKTNSNVNHFESPIIVNENNLPNKNNEIKTVIVQQKPTQTSTLLNNYQPHKQFNLQILSEANTESRDQGTYSSGIVNREPKIINGHTNNNNYQYLVEDQDFRDSTPSGMTEAPSRQFLRNFKNFKSYESSTTTQTFSTSTTRTVTESNDNPCCKTTETSKENGKILEITQRPNSGNFLIPIHAGVRLTLGEKSSQCNETYTVKPPVVNVHKTVSIVQEEQTTRVPVYGDRIIVTTPSQPFVTKPIYIEKQQPIIVEKSLIAPPKVIDRPIYIKSPPETKIVEKIVHHPVEVEKVVEKIVDRPIYIKTEPRVKIVKEQVFVEKPVIKEVKVPVEKTVFIKSPPETKIIHQPTIQTVEKPIYVEKIVKQPYEVERIVEKIVDRPVVQTVEKPVYIEKIVDRPIEKIVVKPVIQTLEKFVDRPFIQTVEKIIEKPVIQTVETPVYIEKFVDRPFEKFIDRPYPVPYAVPVPIEKHIIQHKPDFHIITKKIPTKHNLFDFDSLFGFLSKKKEIQHIYVPGSHQHQLKQLNHHRLIASTFTSIDPIQQSPVIDYSRYATSHLNPIKPVYGVPTISTETTNQGYSYPNPLLNSYAGKAAGTFTYNNLNPTGIASLPAHWLNDNLQSQSQHVQHKTPLIHHDHYVGPAPLSEDYWAMNGVTANEGLKFRRNVENGRSLRIEYGGFLPKMSPSLEIDENGMPLKKKEENT
ncbi:CLUMA_CG004934, isoform A, partial [Clunio marinus]